MKLFITNLCVTIILYFIVYFIKSFIIWDFTNPFQWIIDIPTYEDGDRFLILFCIILWQTFQILIITPLINTKKEIKWEN